jgi:transcription elongation factor Spt5
MSEKMSEHDDKVEHENIKDIEMGTLKISESTEEKEDLTTLFAVRTTINQESNILRQIFYRFRILDSIPDIRAMLISPLLPGYIFIEAAQKRDVQIAIQGIPHIKGRIVGQIKLSEIKHVLVPRSVTEFLEEGDTVEIISGVFEGSRALVMRLPHDSSSSEEVVVRLLQEETPITIKIHGDYLKLVEKKKRVEEEKEAIPEIKVGEVEETTPTDLEKMISFDDEIESEGEEEYAEESDSEELKEHEEEEEEEDDEWAKFDGF